MQGRTARCSKLDADISGLHVHHECIFTISAGNTDQVGREVTGLRNVVRRSC